MREISVQVFFITGGSQMETIKYLGSNLYFGIGFVFDFFVFFNIIHNINSSKLNEPADVGDKNR